MDLHAGQIQGFFDIPSDHLTRLRCCSSRSRALPNPGEGVIARRARARAARAGPRLHQAAGHALAIVDKRRTRANVAEVMNLIGDVKEKSAVILDDMVDTAGTLTQAAQSGARARRQARLRLTACTRSSPARPSSVERRIAAQSALRHQHHPAHREGKGLRQDPTALGIPGDLWRGNPAHLQCGFAVESVCIVYIR